MEIKTKVRYLLLLLLFVHYLLLLLIVLLLFFAMKWKEGGDGGCSILRSLSTDGAFVCVILGVVLLLLEGEGDILPSP